MAWGYTVLGRGFSEHGTPWTLGIHRDGAGLPLKDCTYEFCKDCFESLPLPRSPLWHFIPFCSFQTLLLKYLFSKNQIATQSPGNASDYAVLFGVVPHRTGNVVVA